MGPVFRARLSALGLTPTSAGLAGIVVGAFAIRCVYFTGLHFSDDPDYAMRAFQLLERGALLYTDNNGLRVGTWAPAAAGYALFGVNNVGLTVYPMAMSLIAIVVIAQLGMRLFDATTGLLAAALLAVYPLDVELASRLLPDPLLAAWSLIGMAFLMRADLANEGQPAASGLRHRWRYVAAGMAFAWCAAVNMSSVVLFLVLALYIPVSAIWLARRSPDGGVPSLVSSLKRVLWLTAGVLAIAGPEAVLYRLRFGSFLAKYASTVSHYSLEGRDFFRDLWFYPENTMFLHRGWQFDLPPAAARPYGLFFLVALPCLAAALIRGGIRIRLVALWAVTVFVYLEWGSMSFRSWEFLHRLDRHLELATPPMILLVAWGLTRAKQFPLRLVVTVPAAIALIVTSVPTLQARARDRQAALALMPPVHAALDVFHPTDVITDSQTAAFQQFLDGYRNLGRTYHDAMAVAPDFQADSVAIVHSDSAFPMLAGEIDPLNPPADWQLLADIPVSTSGGFKSVRAYRIRPLSHPALDLTVEAAVDGYVRRFAPDRMTPGTRVVFAWEAVVDGFETVDIRGRTSQIRHGAFLQARNVTWQTYDGIDATDPREYEVIKEIGRGTVRIVAGPTLQNGGYLEVEVDDRVAPGAGLYRWFVVGRPAS